MAYPGGKSGAGVYQRIISLMPPHRVYIEPFLGGGAVLRLKRPAEINIGIDLDPEVVRRWALPSDLTASAEAAESGGTRVPVFVSALQDVGGGRRSALIDLAGRVGIPVLDRRRIPRADDGGSGDGRSSDGRRRLPVESAAVVIGSGDVAGGVANSAGVRSRWNISAGNGISFLSSYRFTGGELVYCDPPYLMGTRSSGRLYACEMSDGAHRRLLRIVKRLPCAVVVSGYWSELYGRELAGWRHESFDCMTRGGVATEHLWMNFPPAVQLHDYRYLGRDRRQREQLKRQKARWLARLGRMPDLQRGALLSAIEEFSRAGAGGNGGGIQAARVAEIEGATR
jgi:hypothetical protein